MTSSPENEATIRRFALWKHRRRASGPAAPSETTAQSVYAELMKQRFAPFLREAGLRGSGGRFELASEARWLLLGFQKSAHSDRDHVRFTVNLLAICREEWESKRAAKPYLGSKPRPSTHYGNWAEHARIGQLTPAGEDKWWSLRPGQDFELRTPRPWCCRGCGGVVADVRVIDGQSRIALRNKGLALANHHSEPLTSYMCSIHLRLLRRGRTCSNTLTRSRRSLLSRGRRRTMR